MSLLDKVDKFMTGGLGNSIVEAIKDYFPPSMSEFEKSEIAFRIKQAADDKEIRLKQLANEADSEFNSRIKEMEGTAKDLKSLPIIGSLVLFMRGAQRPTWGYATMYMDFQVFSGNWGSLTETQESALWVINLLVLGFLFGERAVKNVTPLLARVIKRRSGL